VRGREGDDFPLAGPWNCKFVSGRAACFEQYLLLYTWVLSTFAQYFMPLSLFLLTGMWVLRRDLQKHLVKLLLYAKTSSQMTTFEDKCLKTHMPVSKNIPLLEQAGPQLVLASK